jgi:hypothetical protein
MLLKSAHGHAISSRSRTPALSSAVHMLGGAGAAAKHVVISG